MLQTSSETLAGRYRLGARLGEGGFGSVYEADDLQVDRRVAVKILDPARAAVSPEQAERLLERFLREATATAAIRHPNVVSIFDLGRDGDRVYIAMELLIGRSLAREITFWPHGIEAPRLLPLFIDALRGLAVGHAAGVVHKDLKPENLFLSAPQTADERLRIIDFGVARVLHEQKLTATGKLVGTPRYLAPEYIKHLRVSPALDVYQMGLILVEALCAKPCIPRRLDLVTCCQRHVDGNLIIPAGLKDGAIGPLIARATAVDPERRYPDAGEFADALATIDPQEVFPEADGERRATRRLGVAPLNRATERIAALEAAVVDTQSPSRIEWTEPAPASRPTATGPTRRLGPAADIRAELERLEAQNATADAAAGEEERHTTEADLPAIVGPPDPSAEHDVASVVVSPQAFELDPTEMVDAPSLSARRRWPLALIFALVLLLVLLVLVILAVT